MTAVLNEAGQVQAFSVQVPASELINAVKAVTLAAGTDQSLPVLASVSVTFLDKGIILAATDRYRLAEARYGLGDVKATALVNAKELAAFVKTIKLTAREYPYGLMLTVAIDGQILTVAGDVISRSFRIVDGTFPDYSKLVTINAGEVQEIRFSSKYLGDGMDACLLMASDKRGSARFTFQATDKPCEIVPETASEGWAFKYVLMPMRKPR